MKAVVADEGSHPPAPPSQLRGPAPGLRGPLQGLCGLHGRFALPCGHGDLHAGLGPDVAAAATLAAQGGRAAEAIVVNLRLLVNTDARAHHGFPPPPYRWVQESN